MQNLVFPRQANGRGANSRVNQAMLALMQWTAEDMAVQQAKYVRLREWYNGEHNVQLTERQKSYLAVDRHFPFALNYLRLPVELSTERLTVVGFDGPEGIGGDAGLIDEWWTSGRMDALQNQVHRAAIRDGDTYLLIEWNDETGRPVFSHEPAYDGTDGMKVHYLSPLKRQMTMASKLWTETHFQDDGTIDRVRRLNLYLPDRVEKYISGKGEWEPFRDNPADPWPIPWPIGRIPVVHFRWRDDGGNWGESELNQLIPIQEIINKAVLDEAEAADRTAFQLPTLTGDRWPADQIFTAGDVLYSENEAATWGTIPPADLSGLRERINDYVTRIAQLSHIPLQYFQVTGQISSSATQQADDSQLVAKVSSEAVALGNAWEDTMYIALKLNEEYGDGRDLARGENIETTWADFERIDRMGVEERRATILERLVAAGVSLPGALALEVLGYTEEEQQLMLQMDTVTGIEQ